MKLRDLKTGNTSSRSCSKSIIAGIKLQGAFVLKPLNKQINTFEDLEIDLIYFFFSHLTMLTAEKGRKFPHFCALHNLSTSDNRFSNKTASRTWILFSTQMSVTSLSFTHARACSFFFVRLLWSLCYVIYDQKAIKNWTNEKRQVLCCVKHSRKKMNEWMRCSQI